MWQADTNKSSLLVSPKPVRYFLTLSSFSYFQSFSLLSLSLFPLSFPTPTPPFPPPPPLNTSFYRWSERVELSTCYDVDCFRALSFRICRTMKYWSSNLRVSTLKPSSTKRDETFSILFDYSFRCKLIDVTSHVTSDLSIIYVCIISKW